MSTIIKSNKQKKIGFTPIEIMAATLFWTIAWQLLSVAVGEDLLLASPINVFKRSVDLLFNPDLYYRLFNSSIRIFGGFGLAFISSIVLAVLSYKNRFIKALLYPLIIAMKATPIASIIIIILFLSNVRTMTIFITSLISIPIIYSAVLVGLENIDFQMIEMADVFKIKGIRRFKYIYLPPVLSHLKASGTVAVGLSWKAGVAAELIGIVPNSIGEKLYEAKIYLMSADLLAWTLFLILLSVGMEKLLTLLFMIINKYLDKAPIKASGDLNLQRSPNDIVLEADQMVVKYNDYTYTSVISLKVGKSERVYLMGASGAGKTSLLKSIIGIVSPYSGSLKQNFENVSVVFQEDRLIRSMSALTNVSIVAGEKNARKLLKDFKIPAYKKVDKLSGGMQRRVAIARALGANFDFLILDEPYKGLDEALKFEVADLINQVAGEAAVLLITHSESEGNMMNARKTQIK